MGLYSSPRLACAYNNSLCAYGACARVWTRQFAWLQVTSRHNSTFPSQAAFCLEEACCQRSLECMHPWLARPIELPSLDGLWWFGWHVDNPSRSVSVRPGTFQEFPTSPSLLWPVRRSPILAHGCSARGLHPTSSAPPCHSCTSVRPSPSVQYRYAYTYMYWGCTKSTLATNNLRLRASLYLSHQCLLRDQLINSYLSLIHI